jgi:hypothetical protein
MKGREETEPEIRIIRPGETGDTSRDNTIRTIEQIARLLDSQFLIPGTKIRFGLDPILSLFPVLGDFVTFLISGALIYAMHNHGASRKVVIKMLLNATFDAVMGSIPLIGSVFDVFYRANDRNVRLLKEHYLEGKHEGSGNGILALIAIACTLIVVAAFYGMYKFFEWLF